MAYIKHQAVSPTEIAASGLYAQRARMNVIANNVANALTTRTPQGGAFRRQMAVFRGEQLKPSVNPSDFGVRMTRVKSDLSPLRQVFDPGHPDAREDGYVAYPNVDLAVEMVDLISAQRAYESNIAVMTSQSQIRNKALEIIQA